MGQDTPQAEPSPSGPARTGQAHAHVLAFLMTVVISASFPLGEHITHGLDPAVMMCIRFVLAALLMAPIVAWREGLKLPEAKACLRYFALGAPLAFFFWCMFEALRSTSGPQHQCDLHHRARPFRDFRRGAGGRAARRPSSGRAFSSA